MLRSTNELKGFDLQASDGLVGSVDDFYFDDVRWTIRYIVAETGKWLGRRVLLSPQAFVGLDWAQRAIRVALTKEQIRNSPDADLESPITPEFEHSYFAYYGHSPYWLGASYWGPTAHPAGIPPGVEARRGPAETPQQQREWHVRSCSEVTGYHIRATDGEIGHIDDFIIDDDSWEIRYLRVDTSNWIGGRAVLVPQQALESVSWLRRELSVRLTKDQVAKSPEYDPSRLNPDYERLLAGYYGSTGAMTMYPRG